MQDSCGWRAAAAFPLARAVVADLSARGLHAQKESSSGSVFPIRAPERLLAAGALRATLARAMCGRFFLSKSGAEIARHFDLGDEPVLAPRYNIAPSQSIPVVRANDPSDGARILEMRKWGFVPRFAKALRGGRRPINARAETVATSPLFRGAFARQRGLVPASGFYEWQHRGRSARPFALQVRGGELFAMAALFDRCEADEETQDSCAIVTTEANERVAIVHGRMPAILAPADYALWLDPGVREPERLLPLLRPCPAAWIEAHPVERRVNDVRCDDSRLIEAERDLFAPANGEAT